MVSAASTEAPRDLSRSREVAIRVVAHACGLARSVQAAAVAASCSNNSSSTAPPVHGPNAVSDSGSGAVPARDKPDLSPVTVADYAVQAYVSLALAHAFPADRFIAEESSTALRADPALLAAVVEVTAAAFAPHSLVPEDVVCAIDRCAGGDGPQTGRCWVLDPIDGTRGFVAHRQYCVALALTVDGIPVLGTLGCPALPARTSPGRPITAAIAVGTAPSSPPQAAGDTSVTDCSDAEIGVIFHAVICHGAYAVSVRDAVKAYPDPLPGAPPPPAIRVLDSVAAMPSPNDHLAKNAVAAAAVATVGPTGTLPPPLSAPPMGEPVHVDDQGDPAWAIFCESVEARHSSHELSARVASLLGVKATPVRMDSQAKYGAMSRGNFHIFMRFPKKGYVENVWDHAAGQVVITEAGGKVTDGRGRPLNFTLGRHLDNDDGIVATNGRLHDAVIAAVQKALSDKRVCN
jgi:3'-phosphoadenosine 5'-phosphosulfate (PAPS) 3'-phosphatase